VLTPDEARDLAVLKRARHRIRHRWMWWKANGWSFIPIFFGASCAMLAIKQAGHRDFLSALRRLAAQLPSGWGSIDVYNDAPTTTHADVLQLFDRAIAELE
jgi:hypothetical protein